jgi:NAD-dependent dihydropyrimidine dehydrogenase PreA subunit
MAYVINEPCIGVKDNSCVEVCPVDCIHPTPDEPDWGDHEQLYIDPEECIDCDACVEARARWTPSPPRTRSPRNGSGSSRSTPRTSAIAAEAR